MRRRRMQGRLCSCHSADLTAISAFAVVFGAALSKNAQERKHESTKEKTIMKGEKHVKKMPRAGIVSRKGGAEPARDQTTQDLKSGANRSVDTPMPVASELAAPTKPVAPMKSSAPPKHAKTAKTTKSVESEKAIKPAKIEKETAQFQSSWGFSARVQNLCVDARLEIKPLLELAFEAIGSSAATDAPTVAERRSLCDETTTLLGSIRTTTHVAERSPNRSKVEDVMEYPIRSIQLLPLVFDERLSDFADLEPDLMSFMVACPGPSFALFCVL